MDKTKPTCCLGLCVMNSARGLPAVIENIKRIAHESECFYRLHVIFYYDHSYDGTLNLLHRFQAEYEPSPPIFDSVITVDIIINNAPRSLIRTANIANARNGILEKIRQQYASIPYFIMMDANDYSCVGVINLAVLQEVFLPENIEQWDAVSFDREAGYYDFWALSFGDYVYSFFHFENWRTAIEQMRSQFKIWMEENRKDKQFLPVLSSFNGFSIYKTEKFLDCEYDHLIDIDLFPPGSIEKHVEIVGQDIQNKFDGDTEHRPFHLQSIRRHGSKIRIFPKWLFFKLPYRDPFLRGPA